MYETIEIDNYGTVPELKEEIKFLREYIKRLQMELENERRKNNNELQKSR